MTRRDIVQASVEEFVTASGLTKKSKSWYQRSEETIVVVTLNRSPYGHQYFLTVGVLLRTLDADQAPKDAHCQIRTRLDRLVPAAAEHRVNDLLDLQFPMEDDDRAAELLGVLRAELLPVLDASSTLDGLRSGVGSVVIRLSMVNDEAREVLSEPTGSEAN